MATGAPILLFDGVCNLCSGFVNFVRKRDPAKRIRFASLQSETGAKLAAEYGIRTDKLSTVLWIEDGRVYEKSSAALRALKLLSQPWPLFYALILLPAFLRDGLYDAVAKRRYNWFGKKDICRAN